MCHRDWRRPALPALSLHYTRGPHCLQCAAVQLLARCSWLDVQGVWSNRRVSSLKAYSDGLEAWRALDKLSCGEPAICKPWVALQFWELWQVALGAHHHAVVARATDNVRGHIKEYSLCREQDSIWSIPLSAAADTSPLQEQQ